MPNASTPMTIIAPSGVDGRGGTATLNNSADSNFVGYLYKATGFGGAGIRTSKDEIVEGHGAVLGSFWLSERSVTLEIAVERASTAALSDARFLKLCRAFDAKASDGTVAWTDAGSVSKFVYFRLEQGPSDPDPENAHVLVSGVCADPRIYSGSGHVSSASTSHTLTNAGNTDSPHISVSIASPSATCTITNTTTGKSFTFTGLTGIPTGIDFRLREIGTGSGLTPEAVSWPSSTWLTLAPGSNTVTCTNSMSVVYYDAWSSS